MTSDPYRRFLSLAFDLYIEAGGPADAFDPRTCFHLDGFEEMVEIAIGRDHIARIGDGYYFNEAGWRQAMAWGR